MDVGDAIRGRRSIRKFKDEKVGKGTVEKILEAGRYAPSACNMQMWHFIVVDSDEIKEKLHSVAKSPAVIRKSSFTVFVLYDRNTMPRDYAHVQSAAAAVQNMLLQAYELGVGSVWLNEYGDRDKVAEILKIPGNFMQVAAVAFGYPDESPKCPDRRDGVVSYNSFADSSRIYPDSMNPDEWTMEQIKNYHSFKIRAKSPSSELHSSDSAHFKLVADEIEAVNGKVLDVLPYYANYTQALAKAGKIKDLTVFEMSDEVIDFIKWKFEPLLKGIGAIKGTSNLPVEDERFDCVTCFGALDMIPKPDTVLAEIRRVLKNGGTLYLLFSNKNSPFGLYFRYRMLRHLPLEAPFRPLNYGKVMKSLKGFNVEKVVGINLVPKTALENYKTMGLMKRFCKFVLVKAKKV
jgi:nitroreductase/ubiquinone/menaquinone biosynthesis C-methylase UbiE